MAFRFAALELAEEVLEAGRSVDPNLTPLQLSKRFMVRATGTPADELIFIESRQPPRHSACGKLIEPCASTSTKS